MSLQDDKTQTAQEPDFAKVIKEIMGCQPKAYPSIGYGEDYGTEKREW
jgi:hypothetical protein